ncbi:exonuclease domain-containing protein [Mycetocola manganoxydans]|uniref:exonuclease domain-containing protein n=1 Tax=Mycetocola manganoxydans TaxID=699879 RepID=UPI001C7D270B|nr:exonuclease domain-containing protein [Mycetocola manganoxydans]
MTAVTPWSESLAVFDLETTGIDVVTSRIVSANVGLLDGRGEVLRRRDWLADPGVPIPEQATAVHGITTERARAEGRPAPVVVAEIVAELRGYFDAGIPVVIYNAPYDLSLLFHESLRHHVEPLLSPAPVIDPLVIDKAVDRYRKGKRTLVAAALHYGVELTDAHDAGADAIAAGRVAQAIARTHSRALNVDAIELHRLQEGWCQDQADSFQDYMRRNRDATFVAATGWPVR